MLKSSIPSVQLSICAHVLKKTRDKGDSIDAVTRALKDPGTRKQVSDYVDKCGAHQVDWKQVLGYVYKNDTLEKTSKNNTLDTTSNNMEYYNFHTTEQLAERLASTMGELRAYVLIITDDAPGWVRAVSITGFSGQHPIYDVLDPKTGTIHSFFDYRSVRLFFDGLFTGAQYTMIQMATKREQQSVVEKKEEASVVEKKEQQSAINKKQQQNVVEKKEQHHMVDKKEQPIVVEQSNEIIQQQPNVVHTKEQQPQQSVVQKSESEETAKEPIEKKRKVVTRKKKLAIPAIADHITSEEETNK